jgi:hypothetical protein
VDSAGNLFIADDLSNRVRKVTVTTTAMSFASTSVGSTSSDSPQSVTAQNVGNLPLDAVSPGLVVTGPNFIQVAGPGMPEDCTSSFSLAPGASCNLSISFEPQSLGPLSGSAVFTDNALNASPSASQTIALSGTGVGDIPPALTSPMPGSTLSSGSQTFTWSTGDIGATGFELKLGAGGTGAEDIYDGSATSATSATVTIPADGVTVFATLVYHLNGAEHLISYTYTESGSVTVPSMTSPNPGSTLSTSQTFTWNPGAGPALFELKLGTTPVGHDIYNGAASEATSVTVSVPANSAKVYASLVYHLNGIEYLIPYTYTEPAPTPPALTSPTPGSMLSGGSETFTWSTGNIGATLFELKLGAGVPGANDIYNGSATSATSATVSIPANGITVFATLVYHLNGVEHLISYTYTESGSVTLPSMISPTPGTALSTSQTFTWNPGAGPALFELKLGTTPVGHDIYNGAAFDGASVTVPVPANGAKVYASLVYHLNGIEYLIPYTYTEP